MRVGVGLPRAVLALLGLGGCLHNRALERECRSLRAGMSFADAYRAVTAVSAQCFYHRPGTVDEIVPSCAQLRRAPPAAVSWESPVFNRIEPDQCHIELDDSGRVRSVEYTLGTERE